VLGQGKFRRSGCCWSKVRISASIVENLDLRNKGQVVLAQEGEIVVMDELINHEMCNAITRRIVLALTRSLILLTMAFGLHEDGDWSAHRLP
jgi:hypothetical protein